jgi:hypothetical protein
LAPARRDRQVGWGQGIGQADVGLCAADARPQAVHQCCLGPVACDEVERVHDPALAKTVDAAEPLLEARRIPRQLEVDDASTAVMEVQALTACVGGKQQGRSSCRKPIDRGLALGSTEPTVKEHGIAPERSLHMEQRVAVFGERWPTRLGARDAGAAGRAPQALRLTATAEVAASSSVSNRRSRVVS